ncbi:MBL fold metallo-hydrolase [Salmonella enterica]|nr:MBL fold metallo-hydrolase [Salmonella enterica]
MTNGIKITAPKVHDLSQKKSDLKILRVEQTYPFPVNAFVVEGKCGIVIIDATLTNTASRFIRSMVDGIGKPVDAVLLTHAHPDHYAGLHNVTNGLDVPIISLPAIRDLAREGANKQVISSQADSLIKISRIWADFFPANNRISLFRLFFPPFLALFPVFTEISPTDVSFGPPETGWPG